MCLYAHCMRFVYLCAYEKIKAMKKEVFISISLDKRRQRTSGKYPVRLRVFTPSPRKQKLYPTIFELTEKEFESIWETVKPREEQKQIRQKLQAIENKANEAAETIRPFTFEQFEKKLYLKKGESENIIYQYELVIEKLKSRNQFGTANNYQLSLKSLKEFITYTKGKEPVKILFTEITPDWLEKYERFMTETHTKPNSKTETKKRSLTTVSMYLRALRTVFNNAISDKDIEADIYPFGKRKYQIPTVRNVKKSFNKEQLKQFFEAIPRTPEQEKAKAFWFFSYACNGMNLKDIALLRYKDLKGDKLSFYRAKTIKTAKADLKPVTIYLNDFAKAIIEQYGNKDKSPGNFIFPIISDEKKEYEKFRAIKNFIIFINKNLKKLTVAEGIEGDISTYWARHSFATTAIRNGASMEFVSEALSHNNLKTTQNYFAGFEEKDKKELMEKMMNF